jgi:hypothetical protein
MTKNFNSLFDIEHINYISYSTNKVIFTQNQLI